MIRFPSMDRVRAEAFVVPVVFEHDDGASERREVTFTAHISSEGELLWRLDPLTIRTGVKP